ncbi:MAG: ABC transporter permease subunit [Treponema sp.]|nr:ABC transporter permease subunit [Treponema sp.]
MNNKIRLIKGQKSDLASYFKRSWMLYLMLLLPITFFIIFRYIPMTNIVIAFKNYNMFQGVWASGNPVCQGLETGKHITGCSHWVGFHWFERAFASRDFWNAIRNTIWLNFLDLLVGFPAPIILAILLNELIFKKFKKVTQTIIYLPHFLSWIIVSSIATRLLAPTTGIINIFLTENFGIAPIDFLMDKSKWVITYILFGVWKEMGWGTIIYLAAITGINPELYEAAEVDGAGRWRKIWNVTLPGIRPTIVVLLIMNIGRILGIELDRPYTMMNNIVIEVADVISTLVYRLGIRSFQFSLTAAIGLFQSLICVIFLVAANALAKKFGERGIW